MILPFFFIFYLVVVTFAEEPFCGNKCYSTGITTFKQCYCDLSCFTIFNDCCADANYSHVANQYHNRRTNLKDLLCMPTEDGDNIAIVNQCLPDWQGPESIKISCKQPTSLSADPLGNLIVSNNHTGVSYSNYYCAICNNDAQNLLFWNIDISCPTLNSNLMLDKNEALRYIVYNRQLKSWGYVIRNDGTNWDSFHSCNLTSMIPRSLGAVHQCDPSEIKECISTWKNDIIKQMCETYTDPVFVNKTRYKNFYCAICNKVDISDVSCGDGIGFRYDSPAVLQDRTNFALLVDVNLSEGNNVGKRVASLNCEKGEVFDPFYKKCRNVVCGIPGYIAREGKCIKI